MSYPAYDPAYDSPSVVHGDLRAGLACEDRDLLREAQNVDACVDAALEVTCTLYPPLVFGTFTRPTITN